MSDVSLMPPIHTIDIFNGVVYTIVNNTMLYNITIYILYILSLIKEAMHSKGCNRDSILFFNCHKLSFCHWIVTDNSTLSLFVSRIVE